MLRVSEEALVWMSEGARSWMLTSWNAEGAVGSLLKI